MDGAVAIALVPFLIGQLGTDAFGLLALLTTLVAFSLLADLGLREALSRQLAEQVAVDNKQRFNELASSAWFIYVTVGTLLAVACMLSGPPLARLFNVPPSLEPQAVQLIRWYGSARIWLTFVEPVYSAIIVSNNRFDLLNFAQMGSNILRGLGFFAVLGLTESGLFGWALVALAGQLVRLALLRCIAVRLWPTLRLRLSLARRRGFRSLMSIGGFLFVGQITRACALNSYPVVISAFLGPAAVALYHPGATLVAMARPFIQALSLQLAPLATRFFVTDEHDKLQDLLLRGTRLTFLLGIAVCVPLAVFAEPIARVWLQGELGEGYLITAGVLLGWALIDLSTYAEGSQWSVLLGMKRISYIVYLDLPMAVLTVAGAIILVGYTPLGVLGVIGPVLVFEWLRRLILAVYTARVCGLRIAVYAAESYLRPLAVSGILLAATLLAKLLIGPQSLLPLLACLLGVALLCCPLCWWVGLNRQDRQILRGIGSRAQADLRKRMATGRNETDPSQPMVDPADSQESAPVDRGEESGPGGPGG